MNTDKNLTFRMEGHERPGVFNLQFNKAMASGRNGDAQSWVADEIFEAIEAFHNWAKEPTESNFILLMSEIIDGVILGDMHENCYIDVVSDLQIINPSVMYVQVLNGDKPKQYRQYGPWDFNGTINAIKYLMRGLDSSKTFPKAYIHWCSKNIAKGRTTSDRYSMGSVKAIIKDMLFPIGE